MARFTFVVRSWRVRTFLIIAAIAASCGSASQNSSMEESVQADFVEVKPANAAVEHKYPGSVKGIEIVEIKPQVSGYLDHIFVNEGDYVKKGQPLFRVKGDALSEQVNSSKAALKAALAAQENAQLEVSKIKPLVTGKVVSEVQLKAAETSFDAAKAQVAQAKATLAASKINAAFCLVKAPVSGYIGQIPNRIGNLVSPTDATPLTTLSDINKVYVYFTLSEADFITYQRNIDTKATPLAELIMANGEPYNHKGVLQSASGNIDPATGSIAMKAVFDNPNKVLRSGGSAKVVLRQHYSAALTIPMAAVKDIQDKYFVFVLDKTNKVKMRPVQIGEKTGNRYILKSGLKAGDRIAVSSIDQLTESMTVAPRMVEDKF